ncbi:hypothetical protein SLI_5091 [Streptomyces lividans 1326]|uniref:Uncharacterized protein n=1 Tax=Streptomyces lividans 1326 TaxID=1200984 RepID=A0A7U9DTC4_STRLI|nr:hypothetical protein SLI_5091 [Streptomyces lividans 1326]
MNVGVVPPRRCAHTVPPGARRAEPGNSQGHFPRRGVYSLRW